MFKIETLIDELTPHSTNIVKLVSGAVNNAAQGLHFIRLDRAAFKSFSSDSVSYALM